jgi:perosamine synthetase
MKNTIKIPVYQPDLRGNEANYVADCLATTWISSKGDYITRFQDRFASYVAAKHAMSVCNGTVAMHLCCLALGLTSGDEVIVPTLTYVATVNPVRYVGATPVFVDSLKDSWQMDPNEIRRKITPRTRAIIVVHLYGCPANMPAIVDIANEHGLTIIEDCAEAIGTRIGGRHVGTFGHIAAFSFFGNKTITTGEGGMVVTNDPVLSDTVDRLKGQGLARTRTYWHDIIGYNYRMTNICAAIGLAQMERVENTIVEKQRLADDYRHRLNHLPLEFQDATSPNSTHSHWMVSVLLPQSVLRDEVMRHMAQDGIETRPVFSPVHSMPPYEQENQEAFPVAAEIASRGINLPSWPGLADSQLDSIVRSLELSIRL